MANFSGLDSHTLTAGKKKHFYCFLAEKKSEISGTNWPKPENPHKSGPSAMVDGTRVYVGDWVGFKCDIEQSGQILEIRKGFNGTEFVLGSGNDVFSGGYIGGEVRHTILAEDCWAD